jgi:hypothetical protein
VRMQVRYNVRFLRLFFLCSIAPCTLASPPSAASSTSVRPAELRQFGIIFRVGWMCRCADACTSYSSVLPVFWSLPFFRPAPSFLWLSFVLR